MNEKLKKDRQRVKAWDEGYAFGMERSEALVRELAEVLGTQDCPCDDPNVEIKCIKWRTKQDVLQRVKDYFGASHNE